LDTEIKPILHSQVPDITVRVFNKIHLIARQKTPGEMGPVPLALKKEGRGGIWFIFRSFLFLCGRLLYSPPY
jgi:hypothetical protein